MPLSLPNRVEDFGTALSLGTVRNTNGKTYKRLVQYGLNPAAGAASEGLWPVGGLFNFQTAPEPVRIAAGGNGGDIQIGPGARSVRIFGLDENLLQAEETVQLLGAGASNPTVTTFWRVSRAIVETVGTYGGSNLGDVTIEGDTTAVTYMRIQAGKSVTEHGAYAVPIDHTALVYGVTVYVERSKEVSFQVFARDEIAQVTAPQRPVVMFRDLANVPSGVFTVAGRTPARVDGGTDIFMNVQNTAGGTTVTSAQFELALIPNS